MRVTVLNYAFAPDLVSPEDLLGRYPTLTGWAAALRAAGAQVTVVQRFHRDAAIEREGTRFQFVADGYGPQLRGWQVPRAAHRTVATSNPDLVHVNGLSFPLQLRALRRELPPACPIAVQHHAEGPRRGVRATLQGLGLRAADGFLFAARDLALPWQDARLIAPRQPVFEVMEGSTRFTPRPRQAARAATGMTGSPVFLFVGHLDANKDPLTVLAGFEDALGDLPGARLYLVFRGRQLETEVLRRIRDSAALHGAVTLLGEVAHHDMPDVYSSSDYFLLGSHREGSGYALAEALACGLVPVVTDIPSFRAMTDGGHIGALWPPGNVGALAAAIRTAARRPCADQARDAREIFERRLSWPAIGRDATAAYRDLVTRRRAPAAGR